MGSGQMFYNSIGVRTNAFRTNAFKDTLTASKVPQYTIRNLFSGIFRQN